MTFDEQGNMKVVQREGDLNKAEAEALMKNLEQQLATLTDMNELQRFDLQQKVQDYQQGLNTLSGLLKAQHESMKAIIQNLKA